MTLKNKDLPLVSVIAVSYNHQDFIEENLNSIANQTYSNIELIIWGEYSEKGESISLAEIIVFIFTQKSSHSVSATYMYSEYIYEHN